jgi:periplasmic copper chaperone A
MTILSPHRAMTGLALALIVGSSFAQAEVRLVDGWIPEAAPGSRIFAGYLTLENTGSEARSLVRLSSLHFARVELHRTVLVDGLARMEALSRLDLPDGERLTMQPGGYHLMLIDPETPLGRGEKVEITVEYDDRSVQRLLLEVRPRPDTGPTDHRHHHQDDPR